MSPPPSRSLASPTVVTSMSHVAVVHDGRRGPARIAADLGSECIAVVPIDLTTADDVEVRSACRAADSVVFACSGRNATSGQEELARLDVVLASLSGSGKRLVYVSDTTVIGDTGDSFGNEDNARSGTAPHRWRVLAEQRVERAIASGVHSVVVRAALLHGRGCGELLTELGAYARRSGEAVYVGDGGNRVSTVHIDDLVSLIRLAVLHAPQRTTYVAASTEVLSWRDIARIVATANPTGCVVRSVGAEAASAVGLDAATMSMSNVMRDQSAFRRLRWLASGADLDDKLPA